MSAAPTAHAGIRVSVSCAKAIVSLTRWARSSKELSSELSNDIRTVTNAPSATSATAKPTAIVVSRITRLASERR